MLFLKSKRSGEASWRLIMLLPKQSRNVPLDNSDMPESSPSIPCAEVCNSGQLSQKIK